MIVFDKAYTDGERKLTGRVCGTATLIIEDKFIHGRFFPSLQPTLLLVFLVTLSRKRPALFFL